MSRQQFTGILAAVVTPLTAEGSAVDVDGIRDQVEHILDGGVHGLVPGGSTGEFTTLTMEERKQANAAYVEAAAGRVPVVAGTGALGTADTLELSLHAKDAGAAALMIVPPFYDAPFYDELVAHFEVVSETVDLPIMYYNIPSNTGVQLTPDQLADLARRTNVSSYKDTGGDAAWFTRVLLHHSGDIAALNGSDTLTFGAFALGAKAGVWGAASIIPRLCVDLYQALAVDEDLTRARELWAVIHPVCVFLESHSYAGAIKTGVELVGHPAGPTRRPVLPLAEEHREEFRGLLRAAGVNVVA